MDSLRRASLRTRSRVRAGWMAASEGGHDGCRVVIGNTYALHARKCKAVLPLGNGFIFAVDLALLLTGER